jgi:hypothetical protein
MLNRVTVLISSLLLLGIVNLPTLRAQESVVPDLSGLSVPAAAARLNAVGLSLGVQSTLPVPAEGGITLGTVGSQSFEPGQLVGPEASVDVGVYRNPNASVIYDDNDLTFLNRSTSWLSLNGVSFQGVDGNAANFAAVRWADGLRPGQCTQVWSVSRNGPKGLDECSAIQNWLWTGNSAEHFWLGSRFQVVQNGQVKATCPVTFPGRCDFYLEGGSSGSETLEYIYFAYTAERLVVLNPGSDQWMNVDGFTLYNNYPANRGLALTLSDANLYSFKLSVARLGQLAPGQCISFTNSQPQSAETPQPCQVIAELAIDPGLIFWGAAFEFVSSVDGQRRSCPAGVPGKLTVCIMPR